MQKTDSVTVTKEDREAMVCLEKANAASSGIPAKLIRSKIDAILAGDFDRSPEARSFAKARIEATHKEREKALVGALEQAASDLLTAAHDLDALGEDGLSHFYKVKAAHARQALSAYGEQS